MKKEDLLSPGISACVGCIVESSLRLALKVLGRNTVLAIPPGCMGGTGVVGWENTMGTKIPVFFPLFPNTASMLSGIAAAYEYQGKKINVVGFVGDGGTADIGLQALSGAVERNSDIIYICYDNEGYMNTGMQRSSTTSYGAWTSTTPLGKKGKGKTQKRKDMAMIMAAHDMPYVATASPAFPLDYTKKIEKAMKLKPSYIHILNPCLTGWKYPSEKAIEVAKLSVQSCAWPLYEIENGTLKITHKPGKIRPIKEYVETQGRFKHLTEEEIEEYQNDVNRKWIRLLNLENIPA